MKLNTRRRLFQTCLLCAAALPALTSEAQSRPRLGINRSGSTLSAFWPTNAPGFVLQWTTDLTASTDWQIYPAPQVVTGGNFVASVQPTNSQAFFRLVISIATLPATQAKTNGATLNGSVLSSANTTAWFEYGTTTGYGQDTSTTAVIGSSSNAVAVSNPITGLTPGRLYHFQLVVTNSAGTNLGGDLSFTPPVPPLISTTNATSISSISAVLSGSINGAGSQAVAHFQYGTNTSYTGGQVGSYFTSSSSDTETFSNILSGLRASTTYHYRTFGFNCCAEGFGDDVTFTTAAPPFVMALIYAGPFPMGDNLDGESDAIPTNLTVSAFYMDTNLVTYLQWQMIYSYATSHGYGFVNPGLGKAPNHPVHYVDWYDAVKWCNARSQQEGLIPVYYTDAGLTRVYTNGEVTVYVNWAMNGYRLPTEAEWEKAARAPFSGQRFPWGNTISESQANYFGTTNLVSYDLGPPSYNAAFTNGGLPYTSPVGSFAANGSGLYDMAGNVFEWCWDWYAAPPYPAGSPYLGGSDPRGPASGTNRVVRGGSFGDGAISARCANRDQRTPTSPDSYYTGFRCVRRF